MFIESTQPELGYGTVVITERLLREKNRTPDIGGGSARN